MKSLIKKTHKKNKIIPQCSTKIYPEIWDSYEIPQPIPEYNFLINRKFCIDYAWPNLSLALEIEGGIYTNGRHITPKGFIKDIEKYNLLTENGWFLLRYPPKKIDYLQIKRTVENIINLHKQ